MPSRLSRKLDAFDKLVRPGDLPAHMLQNHGTKMPFQERYSQYQMIAEAFDLGRDSELTFEWYDDAWGAMLFNALRSVADSRVDDDPAFGRVDDDDSGTRSASVSIMVRQAAHGARDCRHTTT